MTVPAIFALQNSDLSEFLYAEVGIERNGMVLTVVSTIARIGRDPWKEASRLAALPKTSATNQLAQIIHDLPTGNWNPAEASVIASRLVQFLPTSSGTAPSGWAVSFLKLIVGPAGIAMLIYVALAAFFIGNFLLQNGQVVNKLMDTPTATLGQQTHGPSTTVISTDTCEITRTHLPASEIAGD